MGFPKKCVLPNSVKAALQKKKLSCDGCTLDCDVRKKIAPRVSLLGLFDGELPVEGAFCDSCGEKFGFDSFIINEEQVKTVFCGCGCSSVSGSVVIKE